MTLLYSSTSQYNSSSISNSFRSTIACSRCEKCSFLIMLVLQLTDTKIEKAEIQIGIQILGQYTLFTDSIRSDTNQTIF